MTQNPQPHEQWEELAAAYALHALDEPEQELFLAHLADCPECAAQVDGYELVTAQLGWLADDEELEAPSWSQLRGQVLTGPAKPRPRVLPFQRPSVERPAAQRRPARLLALAAGVVAVLAAALAAVTIGVGGSSPTQASAIAACREQAGCHVIQLDSSAGPAAVVLVSRAQARMVNEGMQAAPAGRMYVLWQLPRTGRPVPVVGFAGFAHGAPAGPLVRPYGDTAAFAVSLEQAGALPASPSQVLAVGAAT